MAVLAIGIWRDGYETGPGILEEAQKPRFPHRFPAGDAGTGQRDRRGHAGDAQPGRDVGGLAGGAGPVCLQPLPRDDDHRHQHVRRPVLGEKGCGYGGAAPWDGAALHAAGRAAVYAGGGDCPRGDHADFHAGTGAGCRRGGISAGGQPLLLLLRHLPGLPLRDEKLRPGGAELADQFGLRPPQHPI